MKIAGIIAEYNPFHNGHAYQIEQTRLQTGADHIVVLMSGDFVQRGAPALLSKYDRTQAALLGGADLVLELPVCYATGSAEYFASGAVRILDELQVDLLSFGSESGDLTSLQKIATALSKEPDNLKRSLQYYLKKGYSYPQARASALQENGDFLKLDDLTGLLSSPNNILAIEYLKALLSLNSHIVPFTIPRQDPGYHSDTLSADMPFSSATAIRKQLLQRPDNCNSIDCLSASLPAASLKLLTEGSFNHRLVSWSDFSTLLFYRLLSEQTNGYTSYVDVTEDLSNKIRNMLFAYRNPEDFCSVLKSKDLTYTRISRCLLHILLGQKKETAQSTVSYARILGFRKDAAALLSELKLRSTMPLLSKLADAPAILEPAPLQSLEQDILASHLYEGVVSQKSCLPFQNEYQRQLILL